MDLDRNLAEFAIEYFEITVSPRSSTLRWRGNRNFTLKTLKGEEWENFHKSMIENLGIEYATKYSDDVYRNIDTYFKYKLEENKNSLVSYDNIIDFVKDRLDKNQIHIDQLGRINRSKSEEALEILKIDLSEYNSQIKGFGKTFELGLIDNALEVLRFRVPKARKESIVEDLKYEKNANDLGLRRILAQLLQSPDHPDFEIHLAALKHVIWQVKRKMLNRPILDPLMLFLSGKQGQGKSSIIRKIFRTPLDDFYLEQDIVDALDPRSAESKERHFFLLVDELSYLDQPTVAKLKKLITSDEESTRVLGTNAVMKIPNNLTMCATSNYDLMTTIYDETGLRRFWELRMEVPEGTTIDWEEIKNIDILEIWRSVDEDLEHGYYYRKYDIYRAMVEHQKKSVPKSHVNTFLYHENFIGETDESYSWLLGTDLFKVFCEWARDNGVKSNRHNMIWFTKKLEQIGIQRAEYDRNSYFYLSEKDSGCHTKNLEKPRGGGVTVATSNSVELKPKDNGKKFKSSKDVRAFEETKSDK